MQDKIKHFIHTIPIQKAHLKQEETNTLSLKTRQVLCACFIILGILCLAITDLIHESLPYILGSVMIILGSIHIIHGIRTGEYLTTETKLTANGFLFFTLGIVIFANHKNADALIGSIWGVFGLIKATEELNEAIYYFAQKKKFLRKLSACIVSAVLGFLLLLDPMNNVHHHLRLLGLELMVAGIELIIEETESMEFAP